jgi:hypothetical protein
MNKILEKQFAELIQQAQRVEETKRRGSDGFLGQYDYVDQEMLLGWRVKVKNLLHRICESNSSYILEFEKLESSFKMSTNYDIFKMQKAVFVSVKEDFEGGYLSSMRGLIQAEVFDSELEQASELLRNNYKVAAAVIAGVVLETTLRDLCTRETIPLGKLDKMNADLAKKGVYNLLVQKQITALADIRNNAAHGNSSQFNNEDVSQMIEDVRRFVSEHIPE